jgi:hypothetical protein
MMFEFFKRQSRLEQFAHSRKNLRIVSQLLRQTDSLTKKDVGAWREAWQYAIDVHNPQRSPLYDIYRDCLVDLHLAGCIGQRKGMVLQSKIRLCDKNGKEDDRATALLQQEWFYDFCNLALDSRFWGHSLIQFGDIVKNADGLSFTGVELVPRKHVCPEHGVILKRVWEDWRQGISYREGDFARWCVEVGKPDDLGLLLGCAPQCISKKNMLGFWDMFGEIFGAPMRIAKATTTDNSERQKIEEALQNMGSAFWGLFPDGTDIEIKESSRGDAFNVYDKRIDRCNSELSKGILNQTMTIDNGSSFSQSEVHLDVFENVVEADRTLLAYSVNGRLLPFLLDKGFPVQGLHFEWDTTRDLSPTEQRDILSVVLQHYEIDPQYFVDKYNLPVTKVKDTSREPDSFFA